MAAHLVESTAVSNSDAVLDVGCGAGNVTITAARRGADVTGVDRAPSMLETARSNAEHGGFTEISWEAEEATNLPFDDDAFDVTLSALGHIYGDPPSRVARELLRVTRPGGRIGFTSWIPTGVLPVLVGYILAHLPAEALPEFTTPPFVWGDRDIVESRIGNRVDELEFELGTVQYPTLSPTHFWQELATHSNVFSTFLEGGAHRSTIREAAVETIDAHYDSRKNIIELDYLLATATVPSGSETHE